MNVVQFTVPTNNDSYLHFQEDRIPYFYPHLHRHKEIQITWVVNGGGTLILGNTMQSFQSGDIFVIGANQPHVFKNDPSYFFPKNNKNTHSINIFFNPTGFISHLIGFPELLSIKKFIESSNFGMQISGIDANKFGEFFLKIGSTNAGFRLGFFIYLLQEMSNYKNWQYLSTQSFAMNMTDCEGLRMNEIYRYTLDNFQKNITLEEIASVACLTPQSFCRYFKKNNAKTYIQFLNELRINEACKRFIEDNFDSIGNVAYKCGFNSVVSFNRVFKSITKKTPKGFIKTYNYIN